MTIFPIVSSRIQQNYDSSTIDNNEVGILKALVDSVSNSVLNSKFLLREIDLLSLDKNNLASAINASLRNLKKKSYKSYEVKDLHLPDTIPRFLLVPYVDWTRTIENFDPKRSKNTYLGGSSYATNVYTWTEAKVFLFVIDLKTNNLVYYDYKFWSTGLIMKPEKKHILRLLKRCSKSLLKI